MYTLYLSSNDSVKLEKIQQLMTDELWRSVQVKYDSNECFLELIDGTKIIEPIEITKVISTSLPTPTFAERVKNFINALKRMYNEYKLSREIKSSIITITKRRYLCNTCPHAVKTLIGKTCRKCGCNIRLKTLLKSESCPDNKW